MAAAGPAVDTGTKDSAAGTVEQGPDRPEDEREPADRAPRTPSPWDADGDVHPVLERFKRVRRAASARLWDVLCCPRPCSH